MSVDDVYANIYEVFQEYGGPEEGGWYYYCFVPVFSQRCDSELEAKALVEELRAGVWADDPDAREVYSVSYRGGKFEGHVEDRFAYYQPEERPYYC